GAAAPARGRVAPRLDRRHLRVDARDVAPRLCVACGAGRARSGRRGSQMTTASRRRAQRAPALGELRLDGPVCGIDEAGRGPLAGPVYAAAVVLDPARPIRGLRDSKQLDAERRETLSLRIRERARAWAIASASVEEIDSLNILQASLLAMQRA